MLACNVLQCCVQGLLTPKEWALEIKAGAVKEVRFGGSGPLPTNLQVRRRRAATDGPLVGCCWLGTVMQLPLQVVCAVPRCDEMWGPVAGAAAWFCMWPCHRC